MICPTYWLLIYQAVIHRLIAPHPIHQPTRWRHWRAIRPGDHVLKLR